MTKNLKIFWDKIKQFLTAHENISASLFFVSLILIFFFPIVFQGKTLTTSVLSGGVMSEGPYAYTGDHPSVFPVRDPGAFNWVDEPLTNFIGKIIKNEHRIPLWNSNMGLGYPILAGIQLGIYFPLNFINFLFSSQLSWDVFFLIRIFLTGFFTYLFARKITLDKKASLVAGTIFMFSGYTLAFLNMAHFSTELLIPLVLLGTEYFLEKRSAKSFLVYILIIVLTILPGMPEATAFALILGGFWFIFSLFFLHKKTTKKIPILFLFVLANILALLLSAIQLFPFFEFLKMSFNSHSDSLIGMSSLSIETVLSMFYPFFFDPLYSWTTSHFYYIGITTFVLFFIAISSINCFEKKDRLIVGFFSIFALLMLAKIFGFSFINWIGSLPILNLLIFPKYSASIVIFSISIVAAFGQSILTQKNISFLNAKLSLIFTTLLLLTVFALRQHMPIIVNKISDTDSFVYGLFQRIISYFNFNIPTKFADTVSISLTLPFLFAVIITGLFIFLFFWIIILNVNKKIIPATAILVFIVAEICLYTLPLERATRYETFKKPPFIKYLQKDPGIFRIYGQMPDSSYSMLYPNASSVFGIQDIRILMALVDKRYFMFLKNVLSVADEEINSIRFTGNSQLPLDNKFLDLLNVKYFLLPSKISDPVITNQITTKAKTISADATFFKPSTAVLNKEKMQGFMLHAPSKIEIPFKLKSERLTFEYGIAETGIKDSDGVQFSVSIKDKNGKKIQVLSDFIDPQDKKYHKWQKADLDLSEYIGENIVLFLQSDPGKNNSFDQFFFGNFETSENTVVYNKEITIFENKNVLPRTFIVHRAENISTPDNIFTRLKADDFDVRKKIIIEKNLPENMLSGNNSPETDNSSATITSYKDQEVLIDARMENDGFLVLTDQYYPGWKAFVDGKETEIFPTDFIFRSIYLKKGQHQIRFTYDPLSYKIGKYISLTTAILLLALFIFRKKIDQKISSYKKH